MEHDEFSLKSEGNLTGVSLDLCTIMRVALKKSLIRFEIIEGVRTRQRQLELFKQGRSQTMHSKHLIGKAVDIAAYPNGILSWEYKHYEYIANVVLDTAKNMNIEILWGGSWKTLKDGVHFQI